ncbi:hypothetical protein F5Y09DRAFT_333909 [Xylaria sp. FL1042]|nr:hypothetical protein F5Y09DRAFT_333909 [Xylaria sp. FL1042]
MVSYWIKLSLCNFDSASQWGVAECTEETALQGKEWSALSTDERKEYVAAVECLMAKGSRYPTGEVPASNNYYSDFAAHHAELALNVHMSGSFLSFHREFINLMEQSLTLFDSSPSSLGGDGQPVPDQESYVISSAEAPMVSPILKEGDTIPSGSGIGCVVEGPFANTTLYLGPFLVYYTRTGLPEAWTEKNPHCFTRNLKDAALNFFDSADLLNSLSAAQNITDFQAQLNARSAFFLHHGQIDRLWTLWQAEDQTLRRYSYNSTDTFMNPPDIPGVTNSTVIEFGVLGDKVTLEEMADPMAGRYCYRYV